MTRTTSKQISLTVVFILSALTLLLAACGPSPQQKTENLRKETDALAQQVNAGYVEQKETALRRIDIIKNGFAHQDQYDLSTAGMDVSEGGIYKWMEDYLYSQTKDTGGGLVDFYNFYLDPSLELAPENYAKVKKIAKDGPEFETVKREMTLLQYIAKDLDKDKSPQIFKSRTFFTEGRTGVTFDSIYYDRASFLPPGITIEMLSHVEWFKNGLPAANPNGELRWTKAPFAAIDGNGWVEDLSGSIFVEGKYKGMIVQTTFQVGVNQKFFRNHAQKMLFLSPDGSLLGISKPAKEAFKLTELTDFDYVEQMKTFPSLGEDLKLTSPKQPPEIQMLGQAVLAGKTQFEQVIGGKTYLVVVSSVPEVKFYVVGLVEK